MGVMVMMVLMTGCNQQRVTGVDASTPTALAVPTQTPLPTPTPQNTLTPTVIPATATPTPNLMTTEAACKPAAQVTDVTVPDGSRFKPGEAFVKTWRFASSGNCAWEKDTVLAFQGGERFGAADAVPLDAVDIGRSVEISLTMKAPQQAGAYVGSWALRRPSNQVIITTSLRINVFAPTPKPAVVLAPTAKPVSGAPTGPIPPIGSGPFSAEESASGPWNCVGFIDKGMKQWMGDFYIRVRGGSGNYTISDPANCHWDFGEQKFVCRYSGGMNAQIMRTLQVSCPGCTPQPVALYGRGVESREQSSGICRVQTFITPSGPTAEPTVIIMGPGGSIPPVGSGAFNADSGASGPMNCVRVGENDWEGDFYIGAYGGPGNYTISDPTHCQWNYSVHKFVCRYRSRLGERVMMTLEVSCPGCTPQKVALSGYGVKGGALQGECSVK
jgi:hypothetical protein